jgi:hypothetical protein
MFKISAATLEFWKQRDAENLADGFEPSKRMGPDDFRRIEALWGFPLPEAYKEFQSRYGSVEFPDFFCAFDYVYQRETGPKHVHSATIRSATGLETLEMNHKYLIVDPDNETEEPFFPPFMLPFGSDPGTNAILLELGSDTPRVWFWEDQSDAFGRGDNIILGFVANSLEEFINNLRPEE